MVYRGDFALGTLMRFLPIVGMAEVKGVMPQSHLKDVAVQGHGDYHGDILTERGGVQS